MLGLVFWFDMDGDHGIWHFRLQHMLDAIADFMSLGHCCLSRHHKVEVDEGHLPGMARPQVVRFQGANRFHGNDFADFLEVLDGHGFVHAAH